MDDAQPNVQQVLDNEHLRLLAIFHYVLGGIMALFACIPIIHVLLGLGMVAFPHAFGEGRKAPPAFLGWLFLVLGSCLITVGWAFAALVVSAGRCIAARKRYMFCFVVACVECLWMPFGTCLGVFTILVLNRPSVKELFAARQTGLS
jgi:hypothetical protein